MTQRTQARFITFEGGEGAGKSTQVRLLFDALSAQGVDTVTTREPGGSPGAEQIRPLLVTGESDKWDGLTEALLHYAARRDHLRRTIRPALAEGTWVLCDRFNDSTLAYQGYGHGGNLTQLGALYAMVAEGLEPDITFILDLPIDVGLSRAAQRGDGEDRYEGMDTAFHERLRQGFLDIAAAHPHRCHVIDAQASVDAVHNQIIAIVARRFL